MVVYNMTLYCIIIVGVLSARGCLYRHIMIGLGLAHRIAESNSVDQTVFIGSN